LLFVLVGVAAFALALGYVRLAQWRKDAHTTRFSFEDRDTYLFLKLERSLGSQTSDLVAMRALREALRLKLAGVGYQRVLVHVTALRISNSRAFWFLIGALGPTLGGDQVKLAVVAARRSLAESRFVESGILAPFRSIRDAESYLRSDEPPRGVLLDRGQLDSLLDRGHVKAA
jgi:hypothetical protein